MVQSLTDDEMDQLLALLDRFASYDLDQHDAWRIATPSGPVYITFSRELPAGHFDEAYRRMLE